MTTFDIVQLQSGKLVDWESSNPILLEGELAIVFDSNTLTPVGIKAGNGSVAFNDLPFMGAGSFTTYTKEEIDRKLTGVTSDILVLKTNISNILSYLPENVSQTNKLVAKSDLSEIELKIFIPTESQLQTINSGITSDVLETFLKKISNKTSQDQVYIKTADGSQAMIDIIEGSSNSDTGLALKKSGKLKTGDAIELDDAVNKSQLDAAKESLDVIKLNKSTLQDSNEYVYSHLNNSDPLIRVDTGTRADSIVKRSQAGTISASKGQNDSDVVVLQQLDEVNNNLNTHTSNFNNPHKVTKAQIGLGNVNNTSDRDKPISSQTQFALDTKQPKIPGSLEYSKYLMQPPLTDGGDLNLFNLDSLATSKNLEKETSDRIAADNLKVDKRDGYGLSQNDFTDTLKKTYDSAALKISQLSAISGLTLNGEVVPVKDNIAELSNITRSTELNKEIKDRQDQDTTLKGLITDESKARKAADTQISTTLENISKVIPDTTGEVNKLTNKSQVMEMISSLAGFYITSNAAGDAFVNKVALSTATVFYSGGEERVPKKNDYCLVLQDESHNNSSARYIYQQVEETSVGVWQFQYVINDSPLTEDQQKALNSGITSEKVQVISENTSKIGVNTSSIKSLEETTQGLTALVTTNSTEIESIKSILTSLDRDEIIKKFYDPTVHEWATLGGNRIYLKDLNGGQLYTTYKSYLDGLRGLPFLSYVPYAYISDKDFTQLAILVKYGDETQPLYFISEDAGVVLKIDTETVLPESEIKIIYDERDLFKVVTETILNNKLEDYLKFNKSANPTDSDTILVYNKEGYAVDSGETFLDLKTDLNAVQVKSSLDLSNVINDIDSINSKESLKLTSLSGVQFDTTEAISNNSFANLLLEETYFLGIRANSNLPIRLLGASTETASIKTATFDDSSLSLAFQPGSIVDTTNTYHNVETLNIINSEIKFIDLGSTGADISKLTLNVENSNISLDIPTCETGSNIQFTSLKNSVINLNVPDQMEVTFVDVSSSTVYLHGNTHIKVEPSENGTIHAKELEVILCEDYNKSSSVSSAISTGAENVSKITDLRTIIYSSGIYTKQLTSDDSGDPTNKWDYSGNEFKKVITFSEHRCGYLKENFYVPRVKTYAKVSGTTYEEVYDSATIDTSDGTVTVYSNFNIDYLVVIS